MNKIALMCLIALSVVSCTGNPPPVSKTQVEEAADAFCALHEKNKELEARFGLTPDAGVHADVEKGADAFCALRASIKKLETSQASGGSGGSP